MSYLVLALIVNFVAGALGYLCLVKAQAATDNPYRIVWGSAAFWLLLATVAFFTTGWWSFALGVFGGVLAFAVVEPAIDLFTWGRAVIRFANTNFIRRIKPINAVLRFVGVQLQDAELLLKRRPRRQ